MKKKPAPASSTPEPLPNWQKRRQQRDAELEALNDWGREIANRYPSAPSRPVYVGSLRRPRPRRR